MVDLERSWKGNCFAELDALTIKLHDTRSIGVGRICKGDDVFHFSFPNLSYLTNIMTMNEPLSILTVPTPLPFIRLL